LRKYYSERKGDPLYSVVKNDKSSENKARKQSKGIISILKRSFFGEHKNTNSTTNEKISKSRMR
jgi:hypothetical protein